MMNRIWSKQVIVRYALFQVPGIVLFVLVLFLIHRWFAIPAHIFWGLIILWVLKDIVMFPLVWQAYDCEGSEKSNTMIGAEGVVEKRLSPSGYIRVRGELWKAEAMGDWHPIEKGEHVRVLEIRGLKLLVKNK